MNLRLFTAALFTVLLLAACQAKGPSPSTANLLEPSANPVHVTVSPDSGRTVSALVPVEGGTITAEGADGTTFSLAIPGDALETETTISLTPLASLSGLPFGEGAAYAVQLEPEGLSLLNFATLTITPAAEIPVAEQIFFGYAGQGQDVILAAPVTSSAEIQILIQHFSGYGVTKGLLADVELVRARIGGDAERRLQSLVAEQLQRERQRQLLGGDAEDSSLDLTDLFEQFEREVVQLRVAAAGESCAAGRLAIETVLGYERQRQLLGMETSGMDGILDLFETAGTVCVQEEYELCVEQHVIHRMIPVWLGLERQRLLMGGEEGVEPEYITLAKELTVQCLTFELEFDSTASSTDYSGFDSTVSASVDLQLNIDELAIHGTAPLDNTAFTYREQDCTTTSIPGGGDFAVMSLVPEVADGSTASPLGAVSDLHLAHFPGATSESFTITCGDSPPYTSPQLGLWSGVYMILHEDELQMPSGSSAGTGMDFSNPTGLAQMQNAGFQISGWEILGGELYATNEWDRSDGDLQISESGSFTLYHRPGQ